MPSVTDRLLIMYSILLRQLFFASAVVYSGVMGFFYMTDVNSFASELYDAYFSSHLF